MTMCNSMSEDTKLHLNSVHQVLKDIEQRLQILEKQISDDQQKFRILEGEICKILGKKPAFSYEMLSYSKYDKSCPTSHPTDPPALDGGEEQG